MIYGYFLTPACAQALARTTFGRFKLRYPVDCDSKRIENFYS
jgi:hypothetical protein